MHRVGRWACKVSLPWRKGARLEKNYGRPSVRMKQKFSLTQATRMPCVFRSAKSVTEKKGGKKKGTGVCSSMAVLPDPATFWSRDRIHANYRL